MDQKIKDADYSAKQDIFKYQAQYAADLSQQATPGGRGLLPATAEETLRDMAAQYAKDNHKYWPDLQKMTSAEIHENAQGWFATEDAYKDYEKKLQELKTQYQNKLSEGMSSEQALTQIGYKATTIVENTDISITNQETNAVYQHNGQEYNFYGPVTVNFGPNDINVTFAPKVENTTAAIADFTAAVQDSTKKPGSTVTEPAAPLTLKRVEVQSKKATQVEIDEVARIVAVFGKPIKADNETEISPLSKGNFNSNLADFLLLAQPDMSAEQIRINLQEKNSMLRVSLDAYINGYNNSQANEAAKITPTDLDEFIRLTGKEIDTKRTSRDTALSVMLGNATLKGPGDFKTLSDTLEKVLAEPTLNAGAGNGVERPIVTLTPAQLEGMITKAAGNNK
ncbi:MAG: hypothetical protein KDD76_05525, partial [Rickettsiales bacterium]|nr:hypothetical protein [Rickettsiales bacterium]